MSAAENVRRGAELLDQRHPGWAERINLDLLRLGSPCLCVLGQLNGGADEPYEAGLVALGIGYDSDDDAGHGFNLPGDAADDETTAEAWAELDRLWAAQIRARRGAEHAGGEL